MPETRKNQHETVVPFRTEDGIDCNLIRVRSATGDAPKGPVLLVHGAGVRAEIFRAPVETTVVDYLVEHGYEVWLENWRASIDVKPNQWSLDKAAIYDHPEAVRTVVRETGRPEIKAIIHCQDYCQQCRVAPSCGSCSLSLQIESCPPRSWEAH